MDSEAKSFLYVFFGAFFLIVPVMLSKLLRFELPLLPLLGVLVLSLYCFVMGAASNKYFK